MKNLRAALEASGFSCDERTLLFRLKKGIGKTFERNKENLQKARTSFWKIDDSKLHTGKNQTVVLVLDSDDDTSQVQVYAGVYKAKRQGVEGKTLFTEQPFKWIVDAPSAGITAYVGKSPNSGVIYPFTATSKAKQSSSFQKIKQIVKPTRELTVKDDSDIQSLQLAQTRTMRQRHNDMTNRLIALWPKIEVGVNKNALYDALIKDFNGKGDDLMVEVKSESEIAHIRMAIGQLYSYWNAAFDELNPNLAILLPSRPDMGTLKLLKWLKIGILWFADDQLQTLDSRLKRVANLVK